MCVVRYCLDGNFFEVRTHLFAVDQLWLFHPRPSSTPTSSTVPLLISVPFFVLSAPLHATLFSCPFVHRYVQNWRTIPTPPSSFSVIHSVEANDVHCRPTNNQGLSHGDDEARHSPTTGSERSYRESVEGGLAAGSSVYRSKRGYWVYLGSNQVNFLLDLVFLSR